MNDAGANPGPPPVSGRPTWAGLARPTIEFVVTLALCIVLFRTFAAEAYIVPTGSMAPTLLGNHQELDCPNCGLRFNLGQDEEGRSGRPVCPNCGSTDFRGVAALECSGDRLLVQKFLYELRRPRRWEVVVFHYPGEPTQAYVKRVVGLPGESVRIAGGDVLVDGRPARKTLAEQRAMRIAVYDHAYRPADSDRFPRWTFRRGRERAALDSGWRAEGDRFVREPTGDGADAIDWLEYRHWEAGRGDYAAIHDFCSYNGGDLRAAHRINDVMLEARVEPAADAREVVVRLESGSDRFTIELPVGGAGEPTVRRRGSLEPVDPALKLTGVSARALAALRPGRAAVLEASVMDRRLQVALDGELVFDPIDYDDPSAGPGAGERPIALGTRGGGLAVGGLRIFRDVYYTDTLANTPRRPAGVESPVRLGDGEFFVLGDNSPVSNDSRFWEVGPVVNEGLLLGKPFLVHLPGQVVPLQVFGRSVYWVPDPREIRYIR